MNKLINQAERVVEEMCAGFEALYPGMARLPGYNVLVRRDVEEVRERQTAIVSGGGSGHEPAHAGYVGAGMLSAAVAGEVFTSPSAESVVAAIRAVAGEPGALLIVKNYTGDRLNFGLAAEMARAEGIPTGMVVVSDDVALLNDEKHAGRRGIGGTVLIHKIAGAAAASQKDLPQVATLAQSAADDLGTMSISLSAGTAPGADKPSFTLDGEVELGLGIHGERGVRRIPLKPADELVDELLRTIVSALRLRAGERVVALLNNLGATTTMEMAIAARRTLSELEERGFVVERFYAGTFLSSLDMAGISISLLRVDDERLRLLDAPTTAPAWPNVARQRPTAARMRTSDALPEANATEEPAMREPQTEAGQRIGRAISAACRALQAAETELTEMDRLVGDGDLGTNLARGARAVEQSLLGLWMDSAPEALRDVGLKLQEVLGGSSGPLYGVLLLRTASGLENGMQEGQNEARAWANAIAEGCEAISELGGARLGDRTMLDALIPFAGTFRGELLGGQVPKNALRSALRAAESGAKDTAKMVARRGRSSYLGERALGCADPGATAVAIWLRAVVETIS